MKRLSWIVLLVAAAIFAVTHFVWLNELPERLATHFDAKGKANGWMGKKEHSVFMMVLGLGLPGFLMVIMSVMRFLPPSMLNVPKPEYWRSPEHYPEAVEFMKVWSRWVGAGSLIWAIFLNRQIVSANQSKPPALRMDETWFLTGAFVVMIGGMILWLYLHFLKVKEPAETPPSF